MEHAPTNTSPTCPPLFHTNMNEPPQLLRPTGHTSSARSPSRNRVSDDILAHLSPSTAYDALSDATGPLRTCMDSGSVAEREFALRTAVASKSIWEWVDELGDWPWPSHGGSAGFESPTDKRKRLSIQITTPQGTENKYIGSLPAEDISRYELRIEDISRKLDELDVEEIKNHVMTNHIIPLSRPTTPMSDYSTRSSYTRMEDLTAVITAIVVQTLPDLAKLSRLLQVWGLRISVLQRIPALLLNIDDAEQALQSGWMAITVPPKATTGKDTMVQDPTLTRHDFDIMKKVIEGKVSMPGRSLDYMLDRLEGLPDTLPDTWLDRMENVERDYAEWVAACERRIGETEWTKAHRTKPIHPQSSDTEITDENTTCTATLSSPVGKGEPTMLRESPLKKGLQQNRDIETPIKRRTGPSDEQNATPEAYNPRFDNSPTVEPRKLRMPAARGPICLDRTNDTIPSPRIQPPTPSPTKASPGLPSPLKRTEILRWNFRDDICSPISEDDANMSSPELPPLQDESMEDNESSQTSTLPTLRRTSSRFLDMSSDLPELSASPGISGLRIREAEYLDPNDSPPSSPFEPDPRNSSSSELTDTMLTEVDDSINIPKTHFDPDASFNDSYFDDSFSFSDLISPSARRDSTGDRQLRRQISEIIEGIPAKIKLSTEPPNLNPPDLQLPKLRSRPSREPVKKRSASGLSQRTVTPSFTLSPAKNAKARNRGQQEIKVYHLSRSTGEAPIKLFIRCVGEHGERVMVRVGGGWADLSEYLKEYASHHGRRSTAVENPRVEVRDVPQVPNRGIAARSSPPSRPSSSLGSPKTPVTPLSVRKARKSIGAASSFRPRPTTPGLSGLQKGIDDGTPKSEGGCNRSRSNSRVSWVEDDSSFLGLAGPSGKKIEMSEESKAWVESVKQKVRLASGERRFSGTDDYHMNKFGDLGKVGGTKRLFRKGGELQSYRDTKG